MKLSTQTDVIGRMCGDEKAIQIICKSGFDAIDYSMFDMQKSDNILNTDGYKDYVLNLRRIADENGVFFNQSHAPFPSCRMDDDEYNKITFLRIVRAMEISSLLGVDIMVVHPTNISPDINFEYNIEFYNRLLPFARDFGVRIALENMWGVRDGHKVPNVCSVGEDFNRYLDALDRKYFVGCLDIGHCGLVGSDAPTMIREMGHDRIKALHVHDNDNIDDLHVFPFSSKLDWEGITQALADIDYDGVITFEADNTLKNMPASFFETSEKYLHDIGRQLISMIEAKR